MSDQLRPDPSLPPIDAGDVHRSLAEELSATAHRVEHAVEETFEHGIDVAEQTILRRFGAKALRAVRSTLRVAAWSVVVAYFAFGAVLLVTRHAVLPRIDQWRPNVEAIAGRALNARISIGRIDAGWRGFNPHLALNDVLIAGPRGGVPLALPRVDATVSWLSLVTLQPRFSALRVLSPDVSVARLPGDRFAVAGFVLELSQGESEGSATLDWLLAQRRITVRDAVVRYRDERAATPRDVELREVNLTADRSLGSHVFALQATPPAAVAGPIDLRGSLRTGTLARPSDVRAWTGEVFVQLDFADLALLSSFVELPVTVEHAHGAVRAWVGFDEGEIVQSTADVAVLDVITRLRPDLEPLKLASLQGRVTQRRWGDFWPVGRGGHEFGLTQTTFKTAAGLVFPPLDMRLRQTRAAGDEAARTEIEASRIDLESLTAVAAHLPLPLELRDNVARHAIRGTLTNLGIGWSGDAPTLADTTLRARFAALSSMAQPAPAESGPRAVGQPGFENLSGTVRMEQGAGTLELAASDSALSFPGVFAEPRLAFRQLAGTIHWKKGTQLEVRAEGMRAANDDGEVVGGGTWRSTASGPGVIDINGRITRANAAGAFRYVPLVAGDGTREWLEHALLRGRLTEGTYRLRGDLARFPFINPADGDFRIAGHVTAGTLDVLPSNADANGARPPAGSVWPLLTDIDADLLFERASMTITTRRGQAYGARIEQAIARIDRLGPDSVLVVRGVAAGPLADMVRYVNESPVKRWTANVTDGAEVQGPAKLDLQLQIPLARTSDSKVTGSVALQGNSATLAGIPPFTRATGTVGFTERGLRINGLATTVLGGAARIDATTRPDGTLAFSATGVATPAGLRPVIAVGPVQRLLDRSHGSARYSAAIEINDGVELRVDSDLVGLAIDGLAPARKSAQESLPLRIERSAKAAGDDLRVQAGKSIGLRFERRAERGEMRLARGVVALNEPPNLPERGLLVIAAMPRLDLEAWSGLLIGDAAAARTTRPATAADDMQIDLIALRTQELLIHGHRFRNVTLGATRTSDGGYDANVVSEGAVGFVAWRPAPDGQSLGQLTARLSKLVIPASTEKDVVEALRSPPKQMPSLEVSVDQFELSDMKLGRLDLVAHNAGTGAAAAWRVRRLDITNPDMKLAATGEWGPATGGRRTQMKFTLEALDAGGALARVGFPDSVSKGAGSLEGELNWADSPLDIDYASLSGRVALAVDNGRFLKVDAGNAARLLALLSLQSLTRTVTVDGGRQFAEGFAFASIRADATIERGQLKTDNFRMNGASAAVLMSGTLDLRNETQQLAIVVLPEIDASTAALALGVANPVLGLGAYLAQLVLRDPLSKAFAFQYDVTGSWTEPKVTRRNRITPPTLETSK